MPPAFNLSQDQTLQFNPYNNRLSDCLQTILPACAHITLKVLNKGYPPKGISYVTDSIICVSTKVVLFESAPALTTALLSPRSKSKASRLLHPHTPGNPHALARTFNHPGTSAPHPAPTPIGCKFLKSKPAASAVWQRGAIIQRRQ